MIYFKIIGICIVGGICFSTSAQSLERWTFDAAGGVTRTDQFEVHYSLGQLFARRIDLGDISIDEGFIQGSLIEMLTPVDRYPDLNISLSPNPTFDAVRLRTSEMLPGSHVMIFNMEGQLIVKLPLRQKMVLKIGHLSKGSYILQCVDIKNQLIKQFKVIKM